MRQTLHHILSPFGVIGIVIAFFWYTLAYSGIYQDTKITFHETLWNNIYLESPDLNFAVVVFETDVDISQYAIQSACSVDTQYLDRHESQHFFKVVFLETSCVNTHFYLKDEEGNILSNTHFTLRLIRDFDIFDILLDTSTDTLTQGLEALEGYQIDRYFNPSIASIIAKSKTLFSQRQMHEIAYQKEAMENILEKRSHKYLIPVPGYSLPNGSNISKFPGGPRPYRASYTMGVHEGWDINAPFQADVVSLDDGIIVRIQDGWKWEDLDDIVRGEDISYEDKLENLNILRGNQVWIKTMKGDVVFYSHLSYIDPQLQEGNRIKRGDFLGNIGTTGVPDVNYSDYHLHLELKRNPYNTGKTGKNTFLDYMSWDWYAKGQTVQQILQSQYDIFERETGQ